MKTQKKRRMENKTDYKHRKNMLKSEKERIIFRKTNKYIIGQLIKSEESHDSVLIGVNSKNLLDLGWSSNLSGSLKSLPASYLTGYLLGSKIKDKYGEKQVVLDLGLTKSIPGARAYAFAKGVIDSGTKMNLSAKIFPKEERIEGKHIQKELNFKKIKEKIQNG